MEKGISHSYYKWGLYLYQDCRTVRIIYFCRYPLSIRLKSWSSIRPSGISMITENRLFLKVLEEADIKLDSLDALVTRGGNMRAVEGGIYEIGEQMLEDMKSGLYGSYPCSVCNQIAYDMGKELGIPAPGCGSAHDG